jgi:outer membrane protein TolC
MNSRIAGLAACAILVALVSQSPVGAQGAPPATHVLTAAEAVAYALANHPSLRVVEAQQAAAAGSVSLAQSASQPRLDALYQLNRATTNNIAGTTLPQSVLPSVTGPALPNTSWSGVWGSAAGALLSWEPFDFGYRRANVDAAKVDERQAAAQAAVRRLTVATAALDAFLSLVAAKEVTRAAAANVTRREVFGRAVHVLTENQLRAAADASRADAELAIARNQLIRAEVTEARSRVALAVAIGSPDAQIDVEGGSMLKSLPPASAASPRAEAHPFVAAASAGVEQARSRERALDHAYYPRVLGQASFSGKGSGVNTDGTRGGGAAGLGFDRGNWAAGIQVVMPLFDYFSIRDKKRIQSASERVAQALYDEAVQAVAGQIGQAQAGVDGARRIAANTPTELLAATDSERQVRARYEAGLATLSDVSDVQELLVQAEIDDSLARLNVWRELVSLLAAGGDLQACLDAVRGPGGR